MCSAHLGLMMILRSTLNIADLLYLNLNLRSYEAPCGVGLITKNSANVFSACP